MMIIKGFKAWRAKIESFAFGIHVLYDLNIFKYFVTETTPCSHKIKLSGYIFELNFLDVYQSERIRKMKTNDFICQFDRILQ